MCYSKTKNNPLETLRSKIHQDLDTWLDNILDPHAEKGQIVQSTAEFQTQLSKDILDTMDVIYQNSNPDQGNQTQVEKRRKELLSQKFEEILGEMVSELFQEILRAVQKQCEALWAWMKQALGNIMEHVWKVLKKFFGCLAK